MDLDEEAVGLVERLGKWLRVTGSIQLALGSIGLVLMFLTMGCGMLAAGLEGAGLAMLITLLPFAFVAVYVLQGLRTQTAGEQFKNLALEPDVDYLELAFARLKVVFLIDVILGALYFGRVVLQLFGGEL
ncbi:hypothetical protein PPSIR1_24809 [Plesiocystis pacifica SIR-1]|uniref:Uncharacterized protein n=2 Tax=Plesiocystis pacifica TaxID=191768 RepID=A6G9F6_9BACT|nr:hypothetical protein PPSIR1_24809 [Plesiocystis pacifica SIR-1]